jgi:hypothetical protein
MADTPYPLPRSIRQTEVLLGTGATRYGPFGTGWGIFDIEDVLVETRPAAGGTFVPVAAAIEKTAISNRYSAFYVTFPAAITAATAYRVTGKRKPNRQVAVTRGGKIDGLALEEELSKHVVVSQEQQRDINNLGQADIAASVVLSQNNAAASQAASSSASASAATATAAAALITTTQATVALHTTQLAALLGPTVSTKASAYTVLSSDLGTTLNLIGAAYYAVTFGAVGGYAVGSYAITNNDTRAKKIILTGGITYKLWPGQSDIISNLSGAWKSLNGSRRWPLTATTIFYIDQASGVADTDGLASGAGAFNSFANCYQNALNNIDSQNNFVAFYFATGQNYTLHDINFTTQLVGNGQIIIDGNTSNIFLTGAADPCINYTGPAGQITARNFSLFNSFGALASISYPGEINFSTGMVIGASGGPHLQSSGAGSILFMGASYTIAGGGLQHFQAVQLGFIVDYAPVITISANQTYSQFALSNRGGLIQMNANTISLGASVVTGQRYIANSCSGIDGTSANINYFPGNSAGFKDTTSYYT